MNVDRIKEIIERQPNLSTALGMNFISTPDDDLCMATMKVDERNRQPFGFLSGGASLALAENVAGVGSSSLCPGKICVGISVSGSHVKAVGWRDRLDERNSGRCRGRHRYSHGPSGAERPQTARMEC